MSLYEKEIEAVRASLGENGTGSFNAAKCALIQKVLFAAFGARQLVVAKETGRRGMVTGYGLEFDKDFTGLSYTVEFDGMGEDRGVFDEYDLVAVEADTPHELEVKREWAYPVGTQVESTYDEKTGTVESLRFDVDELRWLHTVTIDGLTLQYAAEDLSLAVEEVAA